MSGGNMNRKHKLILQICSFIIIICCFLFFNCAIYTVFTSKCESNFGSNPTQAKIIKVEEYLPFDENSKIVKKDSTLKITEDIPILDGATALLPLYSAFAHAIYPEDSVHFDGTKYTDSSSVQFTDTKYAYYNLIDGSVDIAICAAPSPSILEYAKKQNVELELIPIGYEAFVFLNHVDNPVTNLTVEQIRNIYSGKIMFWNEVGGPLRLIYPLTRPEASGSQSAMISFMKGTEIKKNPIQSFGSAIGFSFRFYVEDLVGNSKVKMISVNGIEPTRENIASKTYPITVQFYAVYRKDNTNPNVQKVIDFMLSDEGQEIINETGYVSIK